MNKQIFYFHGLVFLLLIFNGLDCFSQIADTTIYKLVDTKPQFEFDNRKSTQESVDAFILKHKHWPTDDDIVARINIQCVVEKDGSLSCFKVVKGLNDIYNNASIDVVRVMPKWIPGKKAGRNVRTQINIIVKWDL